ncbi:riboflavin kinase/FMN adenylyltransferase [Cryobacterium mesophilum]|uniref:Riboflavin biosynthesis protein n=1 Tax=Terrimesophilobacter mesophilus TaxID=433647 RepID=A0A4R8V6H0_9MICO|nr:bifunctional riboflavin kinase/FAD synthetase [Terrimesophilobacter mesophilus]MBB5634075.1 riboflavin kinase/FMN adenylyltransferase [Terrimesophilobacter mesophilus]TFB78664.1 bifunctional riboflavin kinase/FAD synthetase [Terrimesophilobacter mesophilus]
MDVYTRLSDVPAEFGPSVVTIGKFDGVHRGHELMIDRLLTDARANSFVPTVLTFDRNPLSVLAPDACPPELVSNAQKLELLDRAGVEATVMLEFTRAFSENSPREFVELMLVQALHAKIVLIGEDFRFGRRGAGDSEVLRDLGGELGFRVDILPRVEHDGRRVSSTWVRELLDAGDVRGAETILGRRPSVRGTVVRGEQRGRELGFPTANLAPKPEGFVPADGVYAAWADVDGARYPAAVSIGNNPTFAGVPERQVEAHIMGHGRDAIELELYGKLLELQFVDRVRGMVAFDGPAALVDQIADDVEQVRSMLSSDPERAR